MGTPPGIVFMPPLTHLDDGKRASRAGDESACSASSGDAMVPCLWRIGNTHELTQERDNLQAQVTTLNAELAAGRQWLETLQIGD